MYFHVNLNFSKFNKKCIFWCVNYMKEYSFDHRLIETHCLAKQIFMAQKFLARSLSFCCRKKKKKNILRDQKEIMNYEAVSAVFLP